MMSSAQRTLLRFGAVVAMTAALVILLVTGLPQRATFTGQVTPGQPPVAPELNAIAPDFERESASGEVIRLSTLRGQPVIVNFWATWCGPCIIEMPILQSILEAHQADGLRILAVNMGEPASVVRQWQETYGFTYDLLIDEAQGVSTLYRLRGQPSTYVIAPDGIITDIFFGPVSESALTAALG